MGRYGRLAGGLAALAVAGVLAASPNTAAGFRKVEPGQPAPEVSLQTVTGDTVSLSSLRGKAVVLSFLRQGQERSEKAAKALEELGKAFADRAAVVGVVVNPGDGDAKAWADGLGVSFPIAVDADQEAYGTYGVLVAPSTGVIDPEGNFVEEVGGYTAAFADEVKALVAKALGEEVREEPAAAVPEKSDARKQAERYLQKAKLLVKRRMPEKAVESAREAVKADDTYAEAHELLGLWLLDASPDNVDEAEAHLKRAMELNPRSAGAKVGLARVMGIRGNVDEAAQTLEEAARISPKPERIYYELGRIYEGAGRFEKAVEAYRKALEKLLH
ncbi:MAG: tetratricopeptide repeat protein [Candidatus Dadabacteria bacterium]|nr:MAG: tetratricopeptide repeat protein [Candidatus Dadabacteria bacterium]